MNIRGAARLDAQALLRAIPEALIIVDQDHHIVAANDLALALFGYAWPDLSGRSVDILVPDGERTQHAEQAAAYMQAPEPRPMGMGRRLYAQRQDGSRFLAEIALGPLPNGDKTWAIAVVRDVTERAEAERSFQETQHRLRSLMGLGSDKPRRT